tara:strand:- start:261 stop:407 length:147 start_codon:yes stop_codon:yes gene_type:complete
VIHTVGWINGIRHVAIGRFPRNLVMRMLRRVLENLNAELFIKLEEKGN